MAVVEEGLPAEEVALRLVDLAESPLARCMDGSAAGYYLAANSSSSSWIIDLQGGGECDSKALCDEVAAIKPQLSSSKFFANSTRLGFLLVDSDANPILRRWNRVHIPYCSQDLWSGQRRNATADTFGYVFAGHHIFLAVLDALDALGLARATDIVVTGDSAGGIGSWMKVDYLAERYAQARVVVAPVAGYYFFAHPYTGPNHTSSSLADFREAAWPGHYALWQSYVNSNCAAHIDPWRCMLANNSFPYVASEAFITESQTDKVQMIAHDWVPDEDPRWSAPVLGYMAEWHANMTVALAPSMSARSANGVFNPACWIHTTFNASTPLIDGVNFIDAFTNWYYKGPGPTKMADDCGLLCNPTCAH